MSEHLKVWKKQARCVKTASSKAGGRMKARRLALSANRYLRMAACPVQAGISARVSVYEMKKKQLLVGAALLRYF